MGRRGSPQKVTTTSAPAAASACARRANGSSRFTAIGRWVSSRAASISARSSAGGSVQIVPRPPAAETAAASRWRETPPPIPACTIGRSIPASSANALIGSEYRGFAARP